METTQASVERPPLGERLRLLETENEELRHRCAAAEAEQIRLVRLVVTAMRLSTARGVRAVLQSLHEVIVDLVGSESYRLYLVSDGQGQPGLEPVAGPGSAEPERATVSASHPVIQQVLAEGAVYVAKGRDESPAAVVPLTVAAQVLGLIVIFGLLPQKAGFTDADTALLRLLGPWAGQALYAAAAHARLGTPPELAAWLRRQLDLTV